MHTPCSIRPACCSKATTSRTRRSRWNPTTTKAAPSSTGKPVYSSLTASRDTRLAAVRSWRATRLAPLAIVAALCARALLRRSARRRCRTRMWTVYRGRARRGAEGLAQAQAGGERETRAESEVEGDQEPRDDGGEG